MAVVDRVGDWFSEQGLSLSKVSQLTSAGCANPEAVAKAALSMLHRAITENDRLRPMLGSLGITSLGLSVSSFSEIQTGSRSIRAFFEERSSSVQSIVEQDHSSSDIQHSHSAGHQEPSSDADVDVDVVEGSNEIEDMDSGGRVGLVQPLSLSDIDQSVWQSLPPSIQEEIRSSFLLPSHHDSSSRTDQPTATATSTAIAVASSVPPSSSSSSSLSFSSSSSPANSWGDIDKAVFESLPVNIQQEIRASMAVRANAGRLPAAKKALPDRNTTTTSSSSSSSRKKPKLAGEGIIKFCKRDPTHY